MTPYQKFINPRYVKLFNNFLDKVVEPRLRKEIHATAKLEMRLYGISIKPKMFDLKKIPSEELTDSQAIVTFFIDIEPNVKIFHTELVKILYEMGDKILGLKYENFYNFLNMDETFKVSIKINERPLYKLDYQAEETLQEDVEPSGRAIKNICDAEKFCKAKGKITFGQLRALVESAKTRKIIRDVGEGGYKATLRLLPWFLPQLAIAGFTGSVIRAFNKVFKPTLEDTTGYKTWWGKVIMRIFNMVEGELNITDPLSKVFFISDGLMTMLDEKEKIKFARHIALLASQKPDDEEVPEFFVENELRRWLNDKFLLNPPLPQKDVPQEKEDEELGDEEETITEEDDEEKPKGKYDYEDTEEYYVMVENLLNKFVKSIKFKNMPNFAGYRVLLGKDRYGDFTIKLTGLFKKPYTQDDSDRVHYKSREVTKLIKNTFPFLRTATYYGGSTSTIDSYEDNLKWEKGYLNRKINESYLPFNESVKNGIKTRVFNENVDNHELKWHFDERDRKVKVLKSNGWKFQMDNHLPVTLKEGDVITIPKGKYHRVLKGNGDLIVKIKEY